MLGSFYGKKKHAFSSEKAKHLSRFLCTEKSCQKLILATNCLHFGLLDFLGFAWAWFWCSNSSSWCCGWSRWFNGWQTLSFSLFVGKFFDFLKRSHGRHDMLGNFVLLLNLGHDFSNGVDQLFACRYYLMFWSPIIILSYNHTYERYTWD